ncbi:hypothetical protein FNF27_03242 [Cafeteria roenbergensis]|uniref:Uncharacterized protein n=1 Tax=Cafeteria roenbergensis TaxID=33653 RepID=A0A5A8CFR3_CAFRO|nr:hypothetical protein FNF29_04289 [Cafeteria roenbergensis]KAA0175234.1 hypothetical protein FNF27_03242 [Cafeteria roenbergensis]|eukprot:KAA0151883.1 hypothetical protein FNF29_04289 [Cafeteria roenbergensis]
MEESKASEEPFGIDAGEFDSEREAKAAAKAAAKEAKAAEKAAQRRSKELAKERRSAFKSWARGLKAKDPAELAVALRACNHRAFMVDGGGVEALVRALGAKSAAASGAAIAALASFLQPPARAACLPLGPDRALAPPRLRQDALRVLRAAEEAGKWVGMEVLVARFADADSAVASAALRAWAALWQGIAGMPADHPERLSLLAGLLAGGDAVQAAADVVVDFAADRAHEARMAACGLEVTGEGATPGSDGAAKNPPPAVPSPGLAAEALELVSAVTGECLAGSTAPRARWLTERAGGAVRDAALAVAVAGARRQAEVAAREKVLARARRDGVAVSDAAAATPGRPADRPSAVLSPGEKDGGAEADDDDAELGATGEHPSHADLAADAYLAGPVALGAAASSTIGSLSQWPAGDSEDGAPAGGAGLAEATDKGGDDVPADAGIELAR